MCGVFGDGLKVLRIWLEGFFQYESTGVGGEIQKCDLKACLTVFQFSKNQGLFGFIFLRSRTSGIFLDSEILGMDGYLIYKGRGGLGLVLGVVVVMVVEFLDFFKLQ